jgi:hypothetical protein
MEYTNSSITNATWFKDKLEQFSKWGKKNISMTSETVSTTQNVQSINPGHNIKIEKLRTINVLR